MDINNILLKYFGGKASKEELNQLDEWKSEGLSNLEKMKEMKELWDKSAEMEGWNEFGSQDAWDSIESKINEEEDVPAEKDSKAKVFSIKNIMKIAAIGLLLVCSKMAYDWSQTQEVEIVQALHFEATGINKEIILPDGTQVVLSPSSSIDIRENFESHRNVKLIGNAFFKVKRDESSPFIVHTSNGKVKVLGTAFNILNHHGNFELFVEEGKVAYSHKERTITLVADDIAVLKKGNIIKSKMYNKNYLSWKSDKLVFRDAQWMDVFKDLSRHYHLKIDFSNVKDSSCKLNTTFTEENIKEVLSELEMLWNLKFTHVNGAIHVSSIGC